MDLSAAALVSLPFVLGTVALGLLTPPTAAQWARADPILLLPPRAAVPWIVPALGVVVAAAWLRVAPPAREGARRAAIHAGAGGLAALAVVGALRGLAGPVLPSFVPAEESAAPGLLLGLCAGLGEEILFRLGVLPLALFAVQRRAPYPAAAGVAAMTTAVAFALLHQAGPGPSPPAWFLTRLLFPGLAMSLGALLVSPSFVVSAHCTAHLLIPVAFSAPPG